MQKYSLCYGGGCSSELQMQYVSSIMLRNEIEIENGVKIENGKNDEE